MTRRSAAVWMALALWISGALAALPSRAATQTTGRSSDCAIILDASASMRGFVSGGSSRLASILDTLAGDCPTRFAFGDSFRSWNGRLDASTFSDSNTRLGEALAGWRARSPDGVAIFVTDNVADTGHGSSDQDAFYRGLQQPAPGFAFVTVVLTRLDFAGQVFPIGPGHGAAYRGPRALTFYVLSPRSQSKGRRALAALRAALEHAGLSAPGDRPGARDYVTVALAPLALARDQRVPIRLTGSEGAQALPDGDGVMVNPASANDQPTFTIEVAPRFSSDWRARSVRLGAALQFPQSDEFGPAASTPCETNPAELTPQTLGQPIQITCRPQPLGPGLDEAQRRALESRGVVFRRGALVLSATVDQSALEMAGALRGWTYDGPASGLARPDPSVQGGVFNLGTLLSRMIPQRQVTSEIARTAVVQRVWLIDAGRWGVGLGLLAVAAVLAGLGALALVKRDYEFTGDKTSPTLTASLRFGGAQLLEPVGGGGLVTVYVLGLGFLLVSRGRDPVTPAFLPSRGGAFSLGPGGARMTVRPVRTRREPRRAGRGGGRSGRRSGGSRR